MKIQNLFTFILFSVGLSAYAQTSLTCPVSLTQAYTYTQLLDCRSCYTKLNYGTADVAKANAYCATKMDTVEFCVQKDTSGIAAAVLRSNCQASAKTASATSTSASGAIAAQQQAAVAAQTANAAALRVAAQASADAAAAAKTAAVATATTAAQQKKVAAVEGKALSEGISAISNAIGKSDDKSKGKSSSKPTAAPTIASSLEDAQKAASTQTSTNSGGQTTNNQSAGGQSNPSNGSSGGTGPSKFTVSDTTKLDPATGKPIETKHEETLESLGGNAPVTVQGTAKAAANLEKVSPAMAPVASDGLKTVEQGGNIKDIPNTEITTSAASSEKALVDMNSLVDDGASPEKGVMLAKPVNECYLASGAALKVYSAKIKEYIAARKLCSASAEKAEFLCVEGSSPGAKAAHAIMDVAGPVLALIGSAQKTCSSTSKVTDMASMVLLAAKAVCITAKLACDSSCGKATELLTELKTSPKTGLTGLHKQAHEDDTFCLGEITKAKGEVAAATPTAETDPTRLKLATDHLVALQGEAKYDSGVMNTVLGQVNTALGGESNPGILGTTPGLAAKCESKMQDIASMAANGLSLLLAKKSADDCTAALAATPGSASGDITTQQYCETSANANTDFCKCQASPQMEGCAGALGSTFATNDGTTTDSLGTSIRPGSGNSGFASGAAAGAVKAGAIDLSGLGPDAAAAAASGDASRSGGGGYAGLGNPASAAGGGAGGAQAAADAAKAKAAAEEKKNWDFGSFASGLFGGKVTGGKVNGDGSGGVSSKTAEAIQRKIASDQLATEVSSASGKSNWEKIKESYQSKESTLDYQGK